MRQARPLPPAAAHQHCGLGAAPASGHAHRVRLRPQAAGRARRAQLGADRVLARLAPHAHPHQQLAHLGAVQDLHQERALQVPSRPARGRVGPVRDGDHLGHGQPRRHHHPPRPAPRHCDRGRQPRGAAAGQGHGDNHVLPRGPQCDGLWLSIHLVHVRATGDAREQGAAAAAPQVVQRDGARAADGAGPEPEAQAQGGGREGARWWQEAQEGGRGLID
mmetsp:Transcript_86201/g.243462  ORF Transcript_86201/g.243462 Transcript_86201/m.243462 type:complete len:219 (-) Transcript_86201:1756-2412(-)